MGEAYSGLIEFLEKYRRKHGKTALPIAMQRMESNVFINGILVTLQTLDIPAIPIHDAIMCRIEDAQKAEQIIYERLLESTKIQPTLRTSRPPPQS